MANYVIIRKKEESSESNKKDSYGICACTFCGELLEIINCVYGISDDVVWMRALADKLNRYDADPIHLCDIIEDELYKKRS